MLKPLFKDYFLLSLIIFFLFIKIFTLNEYWVEHYYTNGIYPFIAKTLRFLFGWIPFSFGDVFYFVAIIYLIYLFVRAVLYIKNNGLKQIFTLRAIVKVLKIVLLVYVFFQALWGINYSRQGIAKQLGLEVKQYSLTELDTLTRVLQERLNTIADSISTNKQKRTNNNIYLFEGGKDAYKMVAHKYPFLNYEVSSLKTSLYSRVGHYIGFTGYYNPFSAEAQINTTIPHFLKPFVVTHEIAHQLGYAKENEANFVAFLTCKKAPDNYFRYSIYFELYLYALREVSRRDTLLFNHFKERAHPQVKKDNAELIAYLKSTQNKIEPYITAFYDQYLKMNRQPKGMRTYNEVVAWLIAYQKKYGTQSI